MRRADLADRWRDVRRSAEADALRSKQSMAVIERLAELYEGADDEERRVLHGVIFDEIGSADEAIRFDAVAIVRRFHLVGAVPALRTLAQRLELEPGPGAPYEWAKVNKLIALLHERGQSG